MSKDLIQCFHFNEIPVRGAIVVLNHSYRQATQTLQAEQGIRTLLGQSLAATALMGVNLKGEALLSLQARGDGQLRLLMAEADFKGVTTGSDAARTICVRGTASYDAGLANDAADMPSLLGSAQLAITISPASGTRYQGIVPLTKSQLEHCLMDYFDQSEQLPTWIRLYANDNFSCGLFLQQMPVSSDETAAMLPVWEELLALSETITEQELLDLPPPTILRRLFVEYRTTLQTPSPVNFGCRCSKAKTLHAVSTFPRQELEAMLAESPCIDISCEFCGQNYQLSRTDLESLLPTQH